MLRWLKTKGLESPLAQLILSCLFYTREARSKLQKKQFERLWQAAWLREHYAEKDNLHGITEHYHEFDRHSADFLLYFLFIPIGTIRLILNNQEVGLPALRDFEVAEDWNGKKVLEITLLSVRPKFQMRTHLTSLLLMRQFYHYAKQHGFPYAVVAADRRLFSMLKRIFIVKQLGEGKVYEGSLTIPACIDLAFLEREMPKRNLKIYQFFTKGLP